MTGHVTIPRLLAAVAVISALALVGCEGNGVRRDEHTKQMASATASGRFICNDSSYHFETIVDSSTGVTYLVWENTDARIDTRVGGITVMLNRDGTPVISEEDTL